MFKKRKKLKIILLTLALLGTVGGFIANAYVKKHGYRNLWHFVSNYASNKTKASSAKVETLEIKIEKEDFQHLKEIRAKALKRGVLIDEGDSFINAKLKHNGKKIKAKIRLKGHMTDHLQDKKWSFRVKTKDGDAFMGMKVFSLQHPGTRNYIYEWVYHQMMKQEGIIALQYDFIRVKVNDEDWGIYAVEEHFAQELVQHNQRIKGPVVRFNPDMYWNHRIAELRGQLVDQPNADFMAANVDAYDDKNTFSDSTILNGYKNATTLLELFRTRKITTAQAFDIHKLAAFHAIIDVVGGHYSLDWSDVKYYYNSVTRKLEPVAYESFSITPTYALCGSNKFIQDSTRATSFHEMLFSDSAYYSAYIHALKRIATKKWVNTFFEKNKKQLESKLAILYKDFAYKDFDFKTYLQNTSRINQLLNHGALIHAYIGQLNNKSITLDIGSIDAFPVQIKEVRVNGQHAIVPATIIPSRTLQAPITYTKHVFQFVENLPDSLVMAQTKVEVVYEVLGSNQLKTVIAIPVTMNQDDFLANYNLDAVQAEKNLEKFTFLKIDKATATITVVKGKHELTQPLIIPAKYTLQIFEGTQFSFLNGSGLISYANINIYGTEDEPVLFKSNDNTGQGVRIISAKKQSIIRYMIVDGLGKSQDVSEKGASFLCYESPLIMENSVFVNGCANAIVVLRSKNTQLKNCSVANTKNDAFVMQYTNATLTNCKAVNGKDDGFVSIGSKVVYINCVVEDTKGVAFLGKALSDIIVANSTIKKCKVAVEAVDGTQIVFRKSHMQNCKLGFKAHKKGDVFGPSKIILRNSTNSKIKTLEEIEKGSSIVQHG